MKILQSVVAFMGLWAYCASPTDWTAFAFKPGFEHITSAQGLSQATVFTILQDRKGFLWFGTEDGLNRYDGSRFTVYRHDRERKDTLGANWVSALLEDRHGHLWVGTMGGGLARIHARSGHIQRIQPSQGLPSPNINVLREDRAGNLWVGTFDRGLAVLPAEALDSESPKFQSLAQKEGLSGVQVQSLYSDRNGILWVGLKDGGLCRLQKPDAPYRFQAYRHDPRHAERSAPLDVTSIEGEQDRGLWVGSAQGLYFLDPDKGAWQRYTHRPGVSDSLGDNHIWRLYRDRSGVLWVGTDGGGLDRMLPQAAYGGEPRFQHFRHDPRSPSTLSSNGVDSIFEDRSGVLWVGTYSGGLNKLVLNQNSQGDRTRPALLHYRNDPADPGSLPGNIVMNFAEDRWGNLWVGHNAAGLSRVRPPSRPEEPLRFEHFSAQPGQTGALQENIVLAMQLDHRGALWVGTVSQGVARMDLQEHGPPRVTHFRHHPDDPNSLSSNFVFSILEDRARRLWIGTVGGGLNLLDPKTGRCRRFRPGSKDAIGDDNVYSLVEDRHGTIWIAGMNHLSRMNPATGAFRTYRPQDLPGFQSYANINQLCLDREGHLWMATNGGGLNRCTTPPWDGEAPQFSHYDTRHGLTGDLILGLKEDDRGRLWLSTHKGLCLFDPQRGLALPMSFQPSLRGVEFMRCASFRSAGGHFFFGSNQGFVVFRPGDAMSNPVVPPVVFTDLQISNQPVPVGPWKGRVLLSRPLEDSPDITLTGQDRVISFQFAALHYVAPERCSYAYKLEGLDRDWSPIGNRAHLTFTTLPPGTYTLRVKGSNSDGIWNHAGASLRLTILPQWWQTWTFRLGLPLLLLGLVALLIRRRMIRLQTQNLILEGRVEERTQALAEQNRALEAANRRLQEFDRVKAGFTAMLVHDIRSPLSGIRATLELIREEQPQESELLTRCQESTDSILAMSNDLLDVFRSEGGALPLERASLDLSALARRVGMSMEPQFRKKGLDLVLALSPLDTRLEGDRVQLERAVGNLLGNALKYTAPGGRVNLRLEAPAPRWFTLEIQDSGRGIPEADLGRIFDPYEQVQSGDAHVGAGLGLAIVKRITEAHGGKVTVQSAVGSGSTFTIWLPQGRLAAPEDTVSA